MNFLNKELTRDTVSSLRRNYEDGKCMGEKYNGATVTGERFRKCCRRESIYFENNLDWFRVEISDCAHNRFSASYAGRDPFRFCPVRIPIFICTIISFSILSSERGHPRWTQRECSDTLESISMWKRTLETVLISKEYVDIATQTEYAMSVPMIVCRQDNS